MRPFSLFHSALRPSAPDRRAPHRHDRWDPRAGHAQLQVRRATETGRPMDARRAARGRDRQHTQSAVARRIAAVLGGVSGQARLRFRHVLVHRQQHVRRGRQQESQPDSHV